MAAACTGQAGDDVEVVDDGGVAQVEQVLAGAAVAGATALPVSYVGQGVLDVDRSRSWACPAGGGLAVLGLAPPGREPQRAAAPRAIS